MELHPTGHWQAIFFNKNCPCYSDTVIAAPLAYFFCDSFQTWPIVYSSTQRMQWREEDLWHLEEAFFSGLKMEKCIDFLMHEYYSLCVPRQTTQHCKTEFYIIKGLHYAWKYMFFVAKTRNAQGSRGNLRIVKKWHKQQNMEMCCQRAS